MSVQYLSLADYLLIAEAVTGVDAKRLAMVDRIDLADSALNAPAASFGGTEFYPDVITKGAVLCARLVKNHPLPDGNKRAAFLSLLEFLERNGFGWTHSADDPDETVAKVEGVASGKISEEELETWIKKRARSSHRVP